MFRRFQETVFEATLRKLAEKKKLRKQQKKEFKKNGAATVGADPAHLIQRTGQAELELMFDDDENDYDMRAISKHERDELSGRNEKKRKADLKKKKKHASVDEQPLGADFQVDVDDARFAPVFDGSDGKFGIDRTSLEFKETKNMSRILQLQQQRRRTGNSGHLSREEDEVPPAKKSSLLNSETDDLVTKLKVYTFEALITAIVD